MFFSSFLAATRDKKGKMRGKTENLEGKISLFEFWPNSIFYTPVVLYWLWEILRFRDISGVFSANPRIETGGLCGESKSAILDMAGDTAQKAIAPYIIFRNSPYAKAQLLAKIKEKSFHFPLVIKPDIGSNGSGVRKVSYPSELDEILALFPQGTVLMAQELITYPLETGIFFIRLPTNKRGKITSITYKEEPSVIGDGVSTILELSLKNERIKKLLPLYLPYLRKDGGKILLKDQRHALVFAGNHRRGSIFWNGSKDITASLEDRINEILSDIPNFYFGRIDLKARSRQDLLEGKFFKIIEINGVGSEATHIWDRRTKLLKAYRDQFFHYDMAFKIGHLLKKKAWRTCSLGHLLKAWRRHKKLTACYPAND